MNDNRKTKKLLIQELEDLRRRIAELEKSETKHKPAEEVIQKNLSFRQVLMDAIPSPIFYKDAEGVYLGGNKAFERYLGLPLNQIIGKTVYDIAPPDLAEIYERADKELLNNPGFQIYETSVAASSGIRRNVIFNKSTFMNAEGKVAGLIGVIVDITDRKQAEEALRENKQLLEMMFLSLHEAVFIIDATNVEILDCNTAASEIFGYSRERMLGRTTTFLHVDEASLEEFRVRLYSAVEEKGYLFLPEFKMKRKDGTVILTEHRVTPLENKRGQRIGWVSVIRDITEIKRTEEALRESEARFRDLAELLPEIVFEMDEQGILTFWNQNAFKSFGYTQEDFAAGLNVLDAVTPDDRGRARENIQRISKDGYIGSNEYLMERKDGSVFPSLVYSTPIIRDDMSVGLRGFIIDITSRKQMEEELRKSQEELEVRVQLRTIELAQSNKELTIEIAERLKMEQALQESKKQLRILASQILTAQENERKRIAIEVHDVLGSSLSAIKYKAEEALQRLPKNGTLNILISKPLGAIIPLVQDTIEEARRIQANLRPPLLDDLGIVATLSWFCRRFEMIYSTVKVEQAVTIREEEVPDHLKIILFRITQEAMNNIGKYAKADSVYLGLQKIDNSAIEMRIKDNGEGFDPESLSYRESLKKGLGLSSMKERVESSGGSFSIESAKGKGTVIRAVWPV